MARETNARVCSCIPWQPAIDSKNILDNLLQLGFYVGNMLQALLLTVHRMTEQYGMLIIWGDIKPISFLTVASKRSILFQGFTVLIRGYLSVDLKQSWSQNLLCSGSRVVGKSMDCLGLNCVLCAVLHAGDTALNMPGINSVSITLPYSGEKQIFNK